MLTSSLILPPPTSSPTPPTPPTPPAPSPYPNPTTPQRKPHPNLVVINTSYDPKAKANSQPMQVSDKEQNLRNTLREQANAERGVVAKSFSEFEKLVSGRTFSTYIQDLSSGCSDPVLL